MWSSQNAHPPGLATQKQRISQPQRAPLRAKGSEPHIRLPSLGVLHQEEEPPAWVVLKASRPYFQENPLGSGKQTPLFKGTHKISRSGTQGRSSHVKGAWARPTR